MPRKRIPIPTYTISLLLASKRLLAAEDAPTAAMCRQQLEQAVAHFESRMPMRKGQVVEDHDIRDLPSYVLSLIVASSRLVEGTSPADEAIQGIREALADLEAVLPESTDDGPPTDPTTPADGPDGLTMQAAVEVVRTRVAFDIACGRFNRRSRIAETIKKPDSDAVCEGSDGEHSDAPYTRAQGAVRD